MRSAADRSRARWSMRRFLACLAAGAGIALLVFWLRGAGTPLARLADALFFGGLAVLIAGVCIAIGRLGFFDLPAFAFRKLRQTLRRAKENKDEETVAAERLTTYAEYLTRPRAAVSCAEALCAGGVYLALCAAALLLA